MILVAYLDGGQPTVRLKAALNARTDLSPHVKATSARRSSPPRRASLAKAMRQRRR